jgi:hypothetical protein
MLLGTLTQQYCSGVAARAYRVTAFMLIEIEKMTKVFSEEVLK